MEAKIVEVYSTACFFCRNGINGKAILKDHEIICLDCARDIARILEGNSLESEPRTKLYHCPYPGCDVKPFDNKGMYLAHLKKHRKQEAQIAAL